MIKQFILDGRRIELNILREYEMYNVTEGRVWARGLVSKDLILKVKLDKNPYKLINNVSEIYKIDCEVNGVKYPWVSYTLDLKMPIDFYTSVDCGLAKNKGLINNYIINQEPAQHSLIHVDYPNGNIPKRDIPRLPIEVKEKFPYDLNTIYWWSYKPYGLVVERLVRTYK
jgi:hypothetical protein